MSQKQYAYFSAAIRDGAKLRPQQFFGMFVGGKTCAWGAGLDALGLLPTGRDLQCGFGAMEEAEQLYPYLAQEREPACPKCGSLSPHLSDAIMHLNDGHKWTREAIADWLYAEEEKLGFVTIDTEAHKPSMIAEFNTRNATVQFALL